MCCDISFVCQWTALRIGKPLDFSRFAGMEGNRYIERAVTDEIMYELMQLSGQQYVDVYAAKLKNDDGTYKTAEEFMGGNEPAA